MNLEDLEKQVQLQEDIQEIENLQKIYGYYFDNNMWAEIIDLFSENAESVEIADHGLFKGKQGIRRIYWDMFAGGGNRQSPLWMQFVVMQIGGVVNVGSDGKTATGRWQTWLFEAKPYGALPRQEFLHGYYENKYVKENGKWLFSKLYWNNTFCSPVEQGWLNLPEMGWMPLPDADQPPTAFHPYPCHRGNVPYHFTHPVTGK
ncbi:MAG: nuclear transport factor 2 family protein [Dehalococcoidales bacterium]|nr:nuclear transport factor 2 family protein [Dehalococcoidales bacterium]